MKSLTISAKNPTEAVRETAVKSVQFQPVSFQTPMKSRFFQGQFLNDRDLAQLQTWTSQRLSLNRFRDGWGAVTGLNVTADPTTLGQIIVNPGYAIDSLGRDIVVDSPIQCDLSQLFSLKDPCERPSNINEDEPEPTIKGVHLYLHYKEKDRSPQTVLGSGSCGEAARCEYSRTEERYSLSWQVDEGGTDPLNTAVLKWRDAYQDSLACLNSFPFTAVDQSNRGAVRRWLRQWTKQQPVTQFHFIQQLVQTLPKSKFDVSTVLRLLFWMSLDARLQFLATPMSSTRADEGVLLGRIWLEEIEVGNKKKALVTAVENEAPHRRPLSNDRWPAPLGLVNGAKLMWQHMAGVTPILTDLGIEFATVQPMSLSFDTDLANGLDALRDLFKLSPFLNPATTVAPIFFDGTAFGFGKRLIGFKNSQELIEPVATGQWQTPDWVKVLLAEPPVLVDTDLDEEE